MRDGLNHHDCLDHTAFDADLRDEGEPEAEFNPGIASRLPKKHIASGALIRDQLGRVLFISPTYKPFLDIPGGIVEANESPLATCRREVAEEIGIDASHIHRLLLVDWLPQHGVWTDSVKFIFDGGVLDPETADSIQPADDEVGHVEFLWVADAKDRLRASMARRVLLAHAALGEEVARYSEFGRLI